MIVELVTFPATGDWDQILEGARGTIPRWTENPKLVRKHYILSEDGQTCQVYWGMTPVTHDELQQMAVDKLKAEVARLGSNITPDDLPEVHIRGDVNTPYKCIGGAIYTMQSAGFARVGFISQPNNAGGVTTR